MDIIYPFSRAKLPYIPVAGVLRFKLFGCRKNRLLSGALGLLHVIPFLDDDLKGGAKVVITGMLFCNLLDDLSIFRVKRDRLLFDYLHVRLHLVK